MKVLTGIPAYRSCATDTFQAVYNLRIPPKVKKHELVFSKGYGVAQNRNKIANYAIENKFDYILFIDSDIIVPPDALEKLLNQKTDIATGWYNCVTPEGKIVHSWMLFDAQNNKYVTRESALNIEMPTPVEDVPAMGFGCVLLKTSLLKQLPYPYFVYLENANGGVLSEDIYFCNLIRERLPEVKIKGVPAVKCLHIKELTV